MTIISGVSVLEIGSIHYTKLNEFITKTMNFYSNVQMTNTETD